MLDLDAREVMGKFLLGSLVLTCTSVLAQTYPVCKDVKDADACNAFMTRISDACASYGYKLKTPQHAACMEREVHAAYDENQKEKAAQQAQQNEQARWQANQLALQTQQAADRAAAYKAEADRLEAQLAADAKREKAASQDRDMQALQCALHSPLCRTPQPQPALPVPRAPQRTDCTANTGTPGGFTCTTW